MGATRLASPMDSIVGAGLNVGDGEIFGGGGVGCGRVGGGVGARIRRRHSANSGLLGKMDGGGSDGGDEGKREKERV